MLLISEVLTVFKDLPDQPFLRKICLSSEASGLFVAKFAFDGKIEDADSQFGHQVIMLIKDQFGAKLTHSNGEVRIEFNFSSNTL